MRSVRHALGPSFGSLALGSAILTAVQIARQAMEVRPGPQGLGTCRGPASEAPFLRSCGDVSSLAVECRRPQGSGAHI